jgi:hypothetical protein
VAPKSTDIDHGSRSNLVPEVTNIWCPFSRTKPAGARTATDAVYFGVKGAVLDTTTGSWQMVSAAPDGNVTGRTIVAAGVRMLVFGGARWDAAEESATLLNDTWIWSPPA